MILYLIFVAFLTVRATINEDPCKIAKRLPSFEIRLKVFKIDPRTDTALCDRYIIDKDGEWYRSEGGNEMVNNATEMYECGTEYGIYMLGNVPSPVDNIVTRKACLPSVDCSVTNYDIQLKNCGKFTAYYLKRPRSCDQAYCFGFGEAGIPPANSTGKPRIKFDLENNILDRKQELVFMCDFDPIPDHNNLYFYKIFWFINDYKSAIYVSKAVQFHQLYTTHLRNSTGLWSIKLGIQISCSVRLYFNPRGPPGPSSARSDKFYAGIQPLQKSYDVFRGENTTIQFRLTVPFGCRILEGDSFCALRVELISPGHLTCSEGIFSFEMCGKKIMNTDWDKTQSIMVQHKNDNKRRRMETFEIHLKSRVREGGYFFWNGVEVPTIFINVKERNTYWEGARCYAQSDPHMTSFMSVEYENQKPGTFTFYKLDDQNGNTQEIQMKVRLCASPYYCVCAIAARAASDIYIIDRCDDDPKKWRFDFMNCVENILHVVKRRSSEYQYEVHFPSTAYLEVEFGIINGVYTLELFMNPSSSDFMASQGLCGMVGTKTLFLSDGKESPNDDAFVDSWRVDSDDDLTSMSINKMQKRFNKTHRPYEICICNKTNPEAITEEITCTNNAQEEFGVTCSENDVKPVKKGACLERILRKKRSAGALFSYIPNNFVHHKPRKEKRSTTTVMTRPQAETWCQNFMNQSPGYVACQSVPNVNSARAIEVCVLDILGTNSTQWATVPREGVKSACMKELLFNRTLQNETDGGVPVVQKIKSVTCPKECSGNGICQNGTCKCNSEYGGGDCSVNLNEPPHVFAINRESGGLCDVNFCKEAMVVGDLFLDRPELMCKMQRFQISYEGKQTDLETSVVQGDHNTIGDIRCNFPHLVKKRSTTNNNAFVTGYRVSVSNNNRNFSTSHLMFILDSTCQDSVNVSGKHKFVLKPGYCFIRGFCIRNGYRKGCYTCDSFRDTFDWTYLNNEKGCTTEKNYLWIIGVVLAVLLVAIASLLIVMILKKKYRVVQDIHVPITSSVEPAEKTHVH